LIEWPEYLRMMDKRGGVEKEKAALVLRRAAKLSMGRKVLGGVAVSVVLLVVTGWIWGMLRHRLLRRREVELLRQQIARDLHDDIGSNLGGIVLLSEIGSEHSPDEDSRKDFATIRQAAEDASLSMRDIVWMIQREPVGLKDLVTRIIRTPRWRSSQRYSRTVHWACCSGGMCSWPSRRCSTTSASTRIPAGPR
jgi:signal transduction histidine kinase